MECLQSGAASRAKSVHCNIQKAIFWKFLPNCQNTRRFAEKLTIQAKLPIGPSSLACPNKSIYLFCALSKDQMQSWKASNATNASPPIASVLDRTAPSANKCFLFSFSLAEYLFVSNARRLNIEVTCVCVSHLRFVENTVKQATLKIAVWTLKIAVWTPKIAVWTAEIAVSFSTPLASTLSEYSVRTLPL